MSTSVSPVEQITMLKGQVETLLERVYTAERINAELTEQYQRLLDWQDCVMRALRNGKVSLIYRVLYISLVDTYPQTLRGDHPIPIQVHKVRENVGWPSERSASYFFEDMQTIEAFKYNPGNYDKKENVREGTLTPNPDIFPYPEYFDTKNVEKRRVAREKEQKKREQVRSALLIFQCEECASREIEYGLLPKCKRCGHVHPQQNVNVDRLSIAPEEPGAVEELEALASPAPEPPKVIPRCKHWQCLNSANRTQWKLNGYYCPIHRGWINEEGRPI